MEIISFNPFLLAWTIVCAIALACIIYFVVKYLNRKRKTL